MKKVKPKKFKCGCKSCRSILQVSDMSDGDYEIKAKDWVFFNKKELRKIFKKAL